MAFKGKSRYCEYCNDEYSPISRTQRFCRECAPDFRYYTFIRLYGLNKKSYDELMSRFDGKCYLCDNKATCVDHNHTTGEVRGALCSGCNSALGYYENKAWLEKALEYKNASLSG